MTTCYHILIEKSSLSESWVPYKWDQPPAITVVGWKTNVDKGWKDDFYEQNLNRSCNIFQNFPQLIKCINEKTLNLTDILVKVFNGDESKQDITDSISWSEDLGNFDLGKAFTLNNSFQVGIDTTRFEIHLKKSFNYTIWVHDPNYYMYSLNPDTVPKGSLKNQNTVKMEKKCSKAECAAKSVFVFIF